MAPQATSLPIGCPRRKRVSFSCRCCSYGLRVDRVAARAPKCTNERENARPDEQAQSAAASQADGEGERLERSRQS